MKTCGNTWLERGIKFLIPTTRISMVLNFDHLGPHATLTWIIVKVYNISWEASVMTRLLRVKMCLPLWPHLHIMWFLLNHHVFRSCSIRKWGALRHTPESYVRLLLDSLISLFSQNICFVKNWYLSFQNIKIFYLFNIIYKNYIRKIIFIIF